MSEHTRRQVLRTAAVAAGLAAAQTVVAPAAAAGGFPAGGAAGGCPPPIGPVTVRPADVRYEELVQGRNKRYAASPDYVRVVGSTQQVVQAVHDAVRAGQRVVVRSGGHCLSDFVDNPAVQVIIDLAGMTQVYFDPARNAFAVEAGATLAELHRRLFFGWGVTVPAGWCPMVGVGGHIAGGGYGVLSREYGLVADHLDAVEVVVTDRRGRVRSVVATRDPADPHHDLWWAHTGGGGGNFGIVTRYWLRTPGVTGTDPGTLLPPAPAKILDYSCTWPWEGMDEQKFARLVRNHSQWCEENAAPGLASSRLYGALDLNRRQTGAHMLIGQVFGPDAEQLLDDFIAALSDGVGAPQDVRKEWKPWMTAVLGGADDSQSVRFRMKSGYLRSRFTETQVSTIYRLLTQPGDEGLLVGTVGLSTYGGKINTVPPTATATSHRDAVIGLIYLAAWTDPALDAAHDAWIRDFYHQVYADTGGVPHPLDGAYINYPDNDLADPAVNRSGIPWSTLYYQDNYPRLQRVKAHYDPLDVFHHALAVRPA
ncbi:FAD/FMN-containing dehydrogenase [Micromonospora profundi]|uniref:FAD-binding oxidoreductase n=1 Tax=Micromonospora profundi TaxID=1420889 RepID=UPI00143AC839|nr:FAD-binding oxidoreductase [Micromonospora profundi]NJC11463.1 FAD/FMN-containing dehydrogenase [Micromonospora profundi]